MKAYTDLEQSKKLAEFLSIESSDMLHCLSFDGVLLATVPKQYSGSFRNQPELTIPCWSLTALLDLLPYPQLSKDKIGADKIGWMVSVYPDNCRDDSYWHNNLVDACYDMILKLHEQKLL